MAAVSFVRTNWLNIIYVLSWGGISFISSFMSALDGARSPILSEDLLHDIFNPLLLWIIAFFGDYLYNVFSLNRNTHILDEKWTRISYVLVELLFIMFLLSIHLSCDWGRVGCVCVLYLCMMGLKTSSLFALCPRQKIVSL